MKKWKKSLAGLLSAAMLLGLLAACDSGEKPSEGPDTPDPSGTPVIVDEEYPITPEELGSGEVKWSEEKTADGWMKVTNDGGETLGYSPDSGVNLMQVGGYAFKDLNKNGKLDLYEDWRQEDAVRAKNLSNLLEKDEIIPLMAVSINISMGGTSGKLSDDQKSVISAGITQVQGGSTLNIRDSVAWVNEAQSYAEAQKYGIPVQLYSDPYTSTNKAENVASFPNNLMLGATFDPSIAEEMGAYLSKVYRAVGIGTLLGPQVDLTTEPRWSRAIDTFGEDPALNRDMSQAATNGHQSNYTADGTDIGWGVDSVNAMVKHWPSDGAAQSGREAHNSTGKFQVYPGDNFSALLVPFTDGVLNLNGNTKTATAVMPSYSIAWSKDESMGELVGSAFSEYKNKLLRSYGFDGVICSDWEILASGNSPFGKPWGVENITEAERAYKALKAGVDQFGGQSDLAPIEAGYQMLADDIGEDVALSQIRESARRILYNNFNIGYFENAYLNTQESIATINDKNAATAAFKAQIKSIVMLKNDDAIFSRSDSEKLTVYIPLVYSNGHAALPIELTTLNKYFNVITDTLSDTMTGEPDSDGNPTYAYTDIIRVSESELATCDFAIVFARFPQNDSSGYDNTIGKYVPITLQYNDYVANSEYVRKESIAGDLVDVEIETPYGLQTTKAQENASYYGNVGTVNNKTDLDMITYVVDNMPDNAKIIVVENVEANHGSIGQMIFSEFETQVDAILVGFGADYEAFLDILDGKVEPSALLPLQMPANMETVEAQYEDVPRDMECYVDSAGNTYDFGFGLNWSGVIQDERTEKYCVPPLTEPVTKPVQ